MTNQIEKQNRLLEELKLEVEEKSAQLAQLEKEKDDKMRRLCKEQDEKLEAFKQLEYERQEKQQIQSQLQLEEQEKERAQKLLDQTLCVVCRDRSKNTILLPCRHFCLCVSCESTLQRAKHPFCPICRKRVEKNIQVYSG